MLAHMRSRPFVGQYNVRAGYIVTDEGVNSKIVAQVDRASEPNLHLDAMLDKANAYDTLVAALRELVERCDGAEGVRADGSNIDTTAAHAAIGDLEKVEE